MWLAASLPVLFLLAACGGGPEPPVSRSAQEPAAVSSGNAAACYARLGKLPISYRILPPRRTSEGCGFDDGVQLLDIGVPVAGLTAISCPAAISLTEWVTRDVQAAAERHFGEPVVRVESYGTYACRSVNGRSGARLSEHAFANAVDIAAFRLRSGRSVRVDSGWRAGGETSGFLRDVHALACKRFGIVIGPDADRFHQDHLHLDMGRGPYCR